MFQYFNIEKNMFSKVWSNFTSRPSAGLNITELDCGHGVDRLSNREILLIIHCVNLIKFLSLVFCFLNRVENAALVHDKN